MYDFQTKLSGDIVKHGSKREKEWESAAVRVFFIYISINGVRTGVCQGISSSIFREVLWSDEFQVSFAEKAVEIPSRKSCLSGSSPWCLDRLETTKTRGEGKCDVLLCVHMSRQGQSLWSAATNPTASKCPRVRQRTPHWRSSQAEKTHRRLPLCIVHKSWRDKEQANLD